MYKKIFVALDNSRHSHSCIDLGIAIAGKFDSLLTGCHVYDASLHQKRFSDMEKGLPPQYQDENTLQKQRTLHTSLISLGLKLISESYLDVFKNECRQASLPHESLLLEGKNYYAIVKELQGKGYDLAIMGALGLAAVNEGVIGSVCERVVRRIETDVLVVKNRCLEGEVVVAVDGSALSFAGVKSAITFARSFNLKLTALSVFDPHYHRVAFESIARVLSKEAGQIFRFKEQETLHEEVIDKGLAKIYQNHLDRASAMAKDAGVEIKTILMDGKPYDRILRYIQSEKSSLLLLGRTGIHNVHGHDIGSTAENLLRLAPCNVLLIGENVEAKLEKSARYSEFRRTPVPGKSSILSADNGLYQENSFLNFVQEEQKMYENPTAKTHNPVIWTKEAQTQTERIPSFLRDMVRKKIEEYAQKKGCREITTNLVNEAKAELMGKMV